MMTMIATTILLLFSVATIDVQAGQAGDYENPIQVGWIDGMNSVAYQIDLESALRKNLDMELIPYQTKYYADGRPDSPPSQFYDSLDVLLVSIEAENTDSYRLGNDVARFLVASNRCVIVTHQSLNKPALTGDWKPYTCMVPPETGGAGNSFANLSLGDYDKDSRLMQGVDTFAGSFRASKLATNTEACVWHANWSDGTPLAATHRTAPVVYLNFYPVGTVGGMTFYNPETDAAVLLRNAVYWCMEQTQQQQQQEANAQGNEEGETKGDEL